MSLAIRRTTTGSTPATTTGGTSDGLAAQVFRIKIDPDQLQHAIFFTITLGGIVLLDSGCQHQLDSVELIDFLGTRIVVDRDNVCLRVTVAQRAEHALSNDVVR